MNVVLALSIRKKRKIFLTLTIFLLVILWNWRETVDDEFLNRDSCPACYGLDQCQKVLNSSVSELQLIFYSKWKLVNKLMNIKNVFYGQTKSTRIYVLKKLAHDTEMEKFDENICDLAGYRYKCNKSQAIKNGVYYKKNVDLITIIDRYPKLFEHNDVIKCKQSRVINLLFDKFQQINSDPLNYFHFVTLMSLNPEPLVMQAFHDVFPMPMYFGACGRVVVEEYAGKPLSDFYTSSWLQRAKLSIQLLKMAVKMSENDIRLYLTDPSSDNFAVDDSGILKIIDTENVVLVDSKDESLEQSVVHHNSGFGCANCFSFDYEDLCNNYRSDHNYFAICKGLLSSKPFSSSLPGGLLHSIPAELEDVMSSAIEECASPKNSKDRRHPAKELLHLLMKAVRPRFNEFDSKPELK